MYTKTHKYVHMVAHVYNYVINIYIKQNIQFYYTIICIIFQHIRQGYNKKKNQKYMISFVLWNNVNCYNQYIRYVLNLGNDILNSNPTLCRLFQINTLEYIFFVCVCRLEHAINDVAWFYTGVRYCFIYNS